MNEVVTGAMIDECLSELPMETRIHVKARLHRLLNLYSPKPRAGGWIQTYSGLPFWPFDPRPEDICIEDIAHHLSLLCRFTGATRQFYSVAQHSVLVSRMCPPEDALWGLLHDASEAYLNDMASPVKHDARMSAYQEAEAALMHCVRKRFGLHIADGLPASVKAADEAMLLAEKRDLLGLSAVPWSEQGTTIHHAVPGPIYPWSAEWAEQLFLERFRSLTTNQEKQ